MPIVTTLNLGDFLQQARRERGLSLGKLAAKVGVNRSTLSRWESGKTVPRPHELAATCVALDLPVSALDSFQESLGRAPVATDSDDTRPPVSGDLLRALRFRHHWTLSETARAANVPVSVLTKWENGDMWPDASRLHTLCFALGASPEETAILTNGRFLPSLLPPRLSDLDALDCLETQRTRVQTQMDDGQNDAAELGLLLLEQDAWRLSRRVAAAHTVLLHTVSMQTILAALHVQREKRVAPVLSRGARYVRVFGDETHRFTVTQQIIASQVWRDAPRNRADTPSQERNARRLLALLPLVNNFPTLAATEYRSWLYMEAARNLSNTSGCDTVSVERLIAAGLAEPMPTGESRAASPSAVRYAASAFARMGQTTKATALIHGIIGDNNATNFYNYLQLARIAWASGDRDLANRHLFDAQRCANDTPQRKTLMDRHEKVRRELQTEFDTNPKLALS